MPTPDIAIFVIGLAVFVIAVTEHVAFLSLSPLATALSIPVYRGSLPQRFVSDLRNGQLEGFRVAAQTESTFLLRPVYWKERGLSAAPFLVTVAKAALVDKGIEVRGYAPISGLLFAGLLALAVVWPVTSVNRSAIAVGAAGLLTWGSVRSWRYEFALAFDRLAKFGTSGVDRAVEQQDAADEPGQNGARR
jgi:hypothetical protein